MSVAQDGNDRIGNFAITRRRTENRHYGVSMLACWQIRAVTDGYDIVTVSAIVRVMRAKSLDDRRQRPVIVAVRIIRMIALLVVMVGIRRVRRGHRRLDFLRAGCVHQHAAHHQCREPKQLQGVGIHLSAYKVR